jgi:membrane-associated phospholipid phosphatase
MLDFFGVSSLLTYLQRADLRVLFWLNHYAATHPEIYKLFLLLTDRVVDLLAFGTLLLFWFWPEKTSSDNLFATGSIERGEPSSRGAGLAAFWRENPGSRLITRDNSRAMALLMGAGCIVAYVVARFLAFEIDVSRPFVSYWPVKAPDSMAGAFSRVRTFSSFPSDQAALFTGFASAVFFWNSRLGWLWTGAVLVLGLSLVALGFHYPSDTISGAFVGIACTWTLMKIYSRRGQLFEAANLLARSFDLRNAPYCYLLYFLLLLVCIEAVRHFADLMNILFVLRYEMLQALGRQG